MPWRVAARDQGVWGTAEIVQAEHARLMRRVPAQGGLGGNAGMGHSPEGDGLADGQACARWSGFWGAGALRRSGVVGRFDGQGGRARFVKPVADFGR